jgi:GrpB-like predicted nucleotidyltransferase (UPF0157 family)
MKVELVPYDSQWPTLFSQEKEALETILGNVVVSIEPLGSTAIPAIASKPVIDILVGVSDLEKIISDHRLEQHQWVE